MSEHSSQITGIQAAFMQFDRRAEKVSLDILTQTFVDAEPLFIQLSSKNNQVLYGRRGTGKTHALKFLAETIAKNGDVPLYIDLRTVGSNGSIYSDPTRPLAERAARLITDVLEALEAELFNLAVEQVEKALNPEQITIRLDDLRTAVSSVQVRGTVEKQEATKNALNGGAETNASLTISKNEGAGFNFSAKATEQSSATQEGSLKQTGQMTISLDFGTLQSALSGLITVIGNPRIWLLIDEWSEIPLDLQPFLADLLRRTVLPQERIIVKIAAIEHRSHFAVWKERADFIGIEIGADMTADINLDDFVVYDVDQTRAIRFFSNLIYRHYKVSDKATEQVDSPDALISEAFTQSGVFQEFVRAVEGVPRDALNLAATVARIAYGRRISIDDVRRAAREWYQQDKMSATKSNPRLAHALSFIISEVIENRRTRAFLFPSGSSKQEIDYLYDARLLHILKKSISSNDEPGKRYDVYKIDYGCYVDLITTSKAPQGLLAGDDSTPFVDVPPDDYRSIRRAILRPEDLRKALSAEGEGGPTS
ncbi:hypothetical protein LG047_00430 [Methylocystis sp. WRRC1]|uniref:ORC-CDC6 family AAA ATPase n=1 Tax=Methylocystis sp. WRRC1 TaxID=1732014 RepID=UPI001D157451|nr:hypothetical protein [Methylocystis sp. WRRC1]MCC3243802.1 hypothetical protein [Methylocystis sp. WRRC1]